MPPILVFQLFSILIQLLDDMGDYKEDRTSGIFTSVIFPLFTNPVLNTKIHLNTLNTDLFKNYINSTYVLLFTFFYHIIQFNKNNIDTTNNTNTDITNTTINNDKSQAYIKLITSVFHQFFYYSITKNEELTEPSLLDTMNINKYYIFDNKSILRIRTIKNNNKTVLASLF